MNIQKLFAEHAMRELFHKHPVVYVDAGAAGGIAPLWRAILAWTRIIGFEPDSQEHAWLMEHPEGVDPLYLAVGLSRQKDLLDFFHARDSTKSSLLKPNRAFIDKFSAAQRNDIIAVQKTSVDSLDHQLALHNTPDVDFIKIDVQGTELWILEGALKTLAGGVYGLEIEVSFAERYLEQPLFWEVDRFMQEQGFELLDLRLYYWKRAIGEYLGGWKGQPVIGKTLYVLDTKKFIDRAQAMKDQTQRKAKVVKAITILLLYGYIDVALEVSRASAGIFAGEERQALEQFLDSVRAMPFRERLPFQRTIGAVLMRVLKKLETQRIKKMRQSTYLGNL